MTEFKLCFVYTEHIHLYFPVSDIANSLVSPQITCAIVSVTQSGKGETDYLVGTPFGALFRGTT